MLFNFNRNSIYFILSIKGRYFHIQPAHLLKNMTGRSIDIALTQAEAGDKRRQCMKMYALFHQSLNFALIMQQLMNLKNGASLKVVLAVCQRISRTRSYR